MSNSTRSQSPQTPVQDDPRRGVTPRALRRAFRDNLFYVVGRHPGTATPNDEYLALAYTVRDRLLDRWIRSVDTYLVRGTRMVCYLSAEFLLGPHLGNNLVNLGIWEPTQRAMEKLGLDLDRLLDQEEEPGLGNGGLGRLAACYLDSLATLQIPAIGYGIRYEFGIFDQAIRDGWQVEIADKWLRLGNPWEIPRPEISFPVGFEGSTRFVTDERGSTRVQWMPSRVVRGIACDTPIPGYRVGNANLLRLWKAEAAESFDLEAFTEGDYARAVEEKVVSETISKVLYPNDESMAGKRLRLEQQYFFVSCTLQDMIRMHREAGQSLTRFHEHYAVQLNDTHPALAVAELVRLLVDEHGMDWDLAWEITRRTCSYTNHTLLPEALETWPVELLGGLLPRHLEIIYEINRRFLVEVRRLRPGDEDLVRRLSLIDETGGRRVRMAHLASVGSHTVNGVAALHTELLKRDLFRDFEALWPGRIRNVTNGVTPRRFMALANPDLTRLLTDVLGEGWLRDLEEFRRLEPLAQDQGFRDAWREVKRRNKERLALETRLRAGVDVDPESLFDVQVKRFHEYKRQHLNVLHAVTLYHRLKRNPGLDIPARTILFAGKAAPGYAAAKRIIRLVHAAADVINRDPEVNTRLRVAFLPDYNVKNSLAILAGADLSEQISTAGKEASGTGNMKLALNGALTIGTLDGANVEIREAVGAEHFFLFGLDVEGVRKLRESGYRPREFYERDEELRQTLDSLAEGVFSGGDRDLFRGLVGHLLHEDPFLVLADYRAYLEAQDEVARAWEDTERWTRSSILNVARMGRFSSDRSIREYARDIWHVEPLPVPIDAEGTEPAGE